MPPSGWTVSTPLVGLLRRVEWCKAQTEPAPPFDPPSDEYSAACRCLHPALGKRLLAGGCAVDDTAIEDAMRQAFRHLKLVVEPGGAAALASALHDLPEAAKGKRVGVVISGGNVDPGQYARIVSA